MLIDWFTVGAQALNFLILVWLMKRYLYKPVLDAVDAREKLIAAKLSDAKTEKEKADKDRDELRHKTEEFDGERAGLMKTAGDEGKAERKRLFDDARRDSDAARAAQQVALESDRQRLNVEIGRRMESEAFQIASKILTDLASTSLEERMVDVFLKRMHDLDEKDRASMKSAFLSTTTPAIVRSSFELTAAKRSDIEGAIKESVSLETPIKYETSPTLIGGLELSANGWKLAWTISDYLGSLEKSVGELVLKEPDPEKPVPEKPVAEQPARELAPA